MPSPRTSNNNRPFENKPRLAQSLIREDFAANKNFEVTAKFPLGDGSTKMTSAFTPSFNEETGVSGPLDTKLEWNGKLGKNDLKMNLSAKDVKFHFDLGFTECKLPFK